MKYINKLNLSTLNFNTEAANAMISLKGGIPLVSVFVRLLTPGGFTVTCARVRAIVVILRRFHYIYVNNGHKGLILYLKANAVLLQQSLGGHMIKDVSPLGPRVSRTNVGIPRLVLRQDRIKFRSGDTRVMRFYLTMFSLYRILDMPSVMKLNSITSGFEGRYSGVGEILSFIPPFVVALRLNNVFGPTQAERNAMLERYGMFASQMMPKPENAAGTWLKGQYSGLQGYPIMKSAPGTTAQSDVEISTHPIVLIRSAVTLRHTDIWKHFRVFLDLVPHNSVVRRAFEFSSKLNGVFKPLRSLGKLGVKEEAAGKARVFAMVDAWTQWVLGPVHEMYFAILRSIPQDGTFNQLKPLAGSRKWASAYSLDLTAATDRIPLFLQVAILAAIVADPQFAAAWAGLLVERVYWLSNMRHGVNEGLKYGIGQPMGALSSWASLAITHHFIVQASAWRSGAVPVGTWYKYYAILGDDLVIGDRVVAESYLQVLSILGVKCGLHKSVLSNGNIVIEFAKRTFYRGEDISPLPLTEFQASFSSLGAMREYVAKHGLDLVSLLKTFGYRYKVLGGLNRPLGKLNSKVRSIILALNLPQTEEEVNSFFSLGARSPFGLSPADSATVIREFLAIESRDLSKSLQRRWEYVMSSTVPFWNLGNKFHGVLTQMGPIVLVPRWLIVARDLGPKITPSPTASAVGMRPIYGPAELKEIKRGWVMVGGDPVWGGKSSVVTMVDPNVLPWREIRFALAALVDAVVLPTRSKILEVLGPVMSQLTARQFPDTPLTLSQVYIWFLGLSREASQASESGLSLHRTAPLERTFDPVAIRLWKRWSGVLQGTRMIAALRVVPQVKLPREDPPHGISKDPDEAKSSTL